MYIPLAVYAPNCAHYIRQSVVFGGAHSTICVGRGATSLGTTSPQSRNVRWDLGGTRIVLGVHKLNPVIPILMRDAYEASVVISLALLYFDTTSKIELA